MDQPSRPVLSNQAGPHQNLIKVVQKHQQSQFAKPVAEHSQRAFECAQQWLEQRQGQPLVFDSCCGVGRSSRWLANQYPQCSVVAVDKSAHRLQRVGEAPPDNLLMLRADLNDFYRLARRAQWRVHRHFVLYPNPWPKSAHLGRRWHAAPVFPDMLALGGELELRTNWKLYAQEFQLALGVYGVEASLESLQVEQAITPFEEKYRDSGQALWQLKAALPRS